MRRFVVWLTAIALCFVLLPAPVGAAGEVYFVSLNDHLLPLSADTMPEWINGKLYVPVPALKSDVAGFSLGLYCSQSRDGGTVTLYNLRQMLVFDLNEGNSLNQHTGEIYPDRAVRKGGRVFLPLTAVCEFFRLEHSYNYTQYGVLVRIKNEYAALNDEKFVDAAGTLMRDYLKEYTQNQGGGSGNQSGENPPDQPKPPVVDPTGQAVQVCFAFHGQDSKEWAEILAHLDQLGYQGLFLLTEEEVLARDDLVRRIVGSGHYIGIRTLGKTVQETREELVRVNRLLAHVARTAATVVLVPEDQRELLRTDGWVCWDDTMDVLPEETEGVVSYARRLTEAIGSREGTVCVTMDTSIYTFDLLKELLERLETEKCAVVAPLETKLVTGLV